jgi:hypothetical protein
MSESINFSQIPVATSSSYLEPGMYRLKIDPTGTKLVEPGAGKTPYVAVKFVSDAGGALTEKFFLTVKALPRLQYLHEAWFGKKLNKEFTNYPEIGRYFEKALTTKPEVSRPMITGGKFTADNKFFSGLPYTGFVVADESLFEEGVFDKDSARYKNVVQWEKPNPAVASTNSAILPEADLPTGGYQAMDTSGDNPW